MEKIRIGISACLLGQNVRYDGGHQHDRYITDTLGRWFEWVPVCPEVEYGSSGRTSSNGSSFTGGGGSSLFSLPCPRDQNQIPPRHNRL